MARILVFPYGHMLAHTSRPFELAKELRLRGHSVIFAGAGAFMRLPRDAGFKSIDLYSVPVDYVLRRARSGRVRFYNREHCMKCCKADLTAIDKTKPDLVLSDFRLTASTSCKLAGVPNAAILNGNWTRYYKLPQRAPEHFALTKFLGSRIVSAFFPFVKQMVVSMDVGPFNFLRKKTGLEPFGNFLDVWMGGDLTLLADTPGWSPTIGLPDTCSYIGPVIWEPDTALPLWYKDLSAAKPVIYVTLGSTGNPEVFDIAARIFADRPWQVVMTTANLSNRTSYPPNFFVASYAPGSAIMQKADLVICQGGSGTIFQALRNGVPVIGIPTMHEQEFNMQRVVDLGLGIQLSELRFQEKDLLNAVARILEDPSIRQRAKQFARDLNQYSGVPLGCDVLEASLGKKNTS